MANLSSPGSQHERFVGWARDQGVRINGVGPVKISGRRLGVVALRRIEAGEELVNVPVSALLTVTAIPHAFRAQHEGITVHGLLASFLAFGGNDASFYAPWRATWPSMRDFEACMPLLWPKLLREPLDNGREILPYMLSGNKPTMVLPPAIAGCWSSDQMMEFWKVRQESPLYRQEAKLKADWMIVSRVFPDRNIDDFTYCWMVVNTRSFYFDALEGETSEKHNDRMVLCPFIDYFNHNEQGCNVAFDDKGYTLTSDRVYDIGEEILTCYGGHTNDFLLLEYGFILDQNKWDSLPLDDFFSGRQLHGNTKKMLANLNYYGNYALSSDGVCHRTQVAVRSQTMERKKMKRFIDTGECDDQRDESRTDAYIASRILKIYYDEAEDTIKRLEIIADKLPEQIMQTLMQRWQQIKILIRSAFINGTNTYTQADVNEDFGVSIPT